MEGKIQIGMTIDNCKPIHTTSSLIDTSYCSRTTMIQSQQESTFDKGSRDGASDFPREHLSFDIPSSITLSNQIESANNLNLINEQANIEGYCITPIDCDSGWRNHDYLNSRCRLMEEIARKITARQTNRRPPKDLPKLVKQIEIILYRCAPSIHSYTNIFTLSKRLEALYVVLKRRLRKSDNTECPLSKTNTVTKTSPICDIKRRMQNTLISKTTTLPEIRNLQSKIHIQVPQKQCPSYTSYTPRAA
mmetsp:Transcript_26907/g.31086  ORF Transcript_26907/g.31086 Transcript_26907/m.31086 type:complete len:248 (+) Transcript_26907:75-818(+)